MTDFTTFLDYPILPEDGSTPRIAVLPCPFDGTSTWAKGADQGPAALLAATPQLEEFDVEVGFRPDRVGIQTYPPVVFASSDPEAAVQAIENAARPALQKGQFLIGLGGEHSVSIGLVNAHRKSYGSFSVLQIDAHSDLRDEYDGSPFNHACVMRRIAESDPAAAIVAVGIRASSEEEFHYGQERGIRTYHSHEIAARGEDWIEEAAAQLTSPVYVTVDLDGLDPSIMPSTGTPMPGGLDWFTTLALLRAVVARHQVIGADIMELKPDPVNHHSQFLAAQLAYKMIAYFGQSSR